MGNVTRGAISGLAGQSRQPVSRGGKTFVRGGGTLHQVSISGNRVSLAGRGRGNSVGTIRNGTITFNSTIGRR
jgi:hypothetical protein